MTTRPAPRALAALAGLVAVLLLAVPPAGAHGGEGLLEVTSVTRSGGDVTVVARLTFVADGHGVPDATVTVVVGDATPVPMTPGATAGDYQATVPAPAGATIRVTSVEPAATAEAVAPEDAATTTTTTAATTTAPPGDAEESPTTEGEATGPTTTAAPSGDEARDSDDGGVNPVVIGAIVAVVVAAGLMAAILLWKRPDQATDPDDGGGAS